MISAFAQAATEARIATIDQPRFTRWGERTAEVRDGFVVPPEGTAHIAVVHRHGQADSRPRVGFLEGWGTWRGAFATTVSHDSHNLTVFGGSAEDLAAAANAVIAAGGGMAVATGRQGAGSAAAAAMRPRLGQAARRGGGRASPRSAPPSTALPTGSRRSASSRPASAQRSPATPARTRPTAASPTSRPAASSKARCCAD